MAARGDGLAPHHDGSPLYVSHAAPEFGDVVTVRVRMPEAYGPITRVFVRCHPDHEPAWTDARCDGVAGGWVWWSADIAVVNPRHGYRFHLVHADGRVEFLTQAGLTDVDPLDVFDFAILATNPPPSWFDDAVIYQIFPDRFARSAAADQRTPPAWAAPASWSDPVEPVWPARARQFYGGDLDGAREKLDHLSDLGVTVLYHTPIFAAESNHRYDSANFDEVDAHLGGSDAYVRLIEAAHARGIHVIGDLTSNHSGIAHEWFRTAYGNPDAPEGEFYYFYDDARTEYETWLNATTLPKFNWNSAELRRRFIEGPGSVVARWLKPPYNTDGWRIDVANMTGRLGAEDLNEQVRRTIRATMLEVAPDTLLLAESTNDATGDLQGDAWHGGMTYAPFTRGVWAWLGDPVRVPYVTARGEVRDDPWYFGVPTGFARYTARQFVEQFVRFTSTVPWRVQRGTMAALDTHDTARFATYASAEAIPVAVGLSMTLPGIPVVYAGDEFGLTAADGEMSRAPMPWGRASEPAVAERIALYRTLIGLRRRFSALASGGLRWLHVDDAGVVFARESDADTIVVLACRGDVDVVLPAHAVPGGVAEELFGVAEWMPVGDGAVRCSATGPAFAMWRLPGVAVPGAAPSEGVHPGAARS